VGRDQPHGYLIWGVQDDTHAIVGTSFVPLATKKGNEPLENWLLARVAPILASRLTNTRIVKRLLGVAVQREVPAYAKRTFESWFRSHSPASRAGRRGEVVLFCDEFTDFTEFEEAVDAFDDASEGIDPGLDDDLYAIDPVPREDDDTQA